MSGRRSDERGDRSFAGFREAVFVDHRLLLELRQPRQRDGYVAHVVSTGVKHGFSFDAADVHAAMRDGELAWLTMDANAP